MNTATPERLTDAYLDELLPRSAARRAAEAQATVEDFLAGQRKRLNPPPRQRQAGLFTPAATWSSEQWKRLT